MPEREYAPGISVSKSLTPRFRLLTLSSRINNDIGKALDQTLHAFFM